MSSMVSGDGLRLLRSGLRGSRSPMLRIAGWSVLEACPALAAGWVTATAIDRGFLAGRPFAGLGWLTLLGVLYVVRSAAERAMFPHLAEVVEPLRDHLVRRLVESALRQAASGSGSTPDAAGVARLTGQVDSVRGLVATLLRTARPLAATLLAAIIGLVTLNPVAAALVLPPMLLALLVLPLTLRAMSRRFRASVLAEESVAVRTGQVLDARHDIFALGAQDRAAGEVEEGALGYARAGVATARLSAVRILIVFLGGHLPLLGLLLAGPWLVSSGRISAGALVGAVTYVTGYLVAALQALTGSVGGQWIHLGTVLTRLAETTAAPGTSDAPAPAHAPTPEGYELSVDRLTFGYGPHAEAVLHDLSMSVPEDEHLVIVGSSGIGKSTLAGLLAGLAAPDSGTVRLGGADAAVLDDRLRSRTIALVPQQAYVFHGTVRENLTYLNSEVTDAELARDAALLGAKAVIDRLGGLDAEITDPATQLSSGEGQLLVLVRVFVSPARVVILDEATCHLDPPAEARAEKVFADRPGTLIVIAHRIASAHRAGRVLLLDGDRADLGTHGELLVRSTGYADLVGRWRPEDAT